MIYGTPFRGIFYSFIKHHPKSSITDFVNVTASSSFSGRGDPIIVIDPRRTASISGEGWMTNSEENSSITFTLLRDNLTLHSYSLKSRIDYSCIYPLEWILEGSNDINNWELIHHKERGHEIDGKGKVGKWSCTLRKAFKSFRITQLGYNMYCDNDPKYHFALNKIEVYGKLGISYAEITCRIKSYFDAYFSFYAIIIMNIY